MVENSAVTKRCRGRPQIRSDRETLELIVEAAAAEFQANGFAATTMGTVAQRAGISTKTMYRLVPCKADLFEKVISERIGTFMLEVNPAELDKYELCEAMEHILVSFGTLTLSKATIGLLRLVIGESDRFPEIAAAFHHIAVVQTTDAIAGWLERQRDRGLLKIDDPVRSASALRGMMTMDLQRSAMLGVGHVPTAEEIEARAKFCARLFLDGCRA
ncbi:TetR/AcrR family transcriptional regulator [Hyphomicrobium sp.]|uniref:TetR/AcrR family transcriptional regulator n=1 Tax=Hyphomicrobium sp. TaxID=82 RepID=UPI000FBCF884|nr:TetR/AcrR family transcriptional regulator [Hyphomicrobium sp.]RUO98283.1 MAG: TetR/AcrR family transcriptional regulator [Hyphomicrobium sp.]